jgi:serine/threonine protein kinase/tetratricopeptide (TPR) repeat protein
MSSLRELTDRYRLEKILSSSRGGTVLRATDTGSGQAVAIKLITMAGGAAPERAQAFYRYAGDLEALRHPSLPSVLDSGFTTDGSAFLVCELLSGIGFETLSGGAPERLLPLLIQALDGLAALAAQQLGHYNVSPPNLFVVAGIAGSEQVKLLGLGSSVFRFPEMTAAGASSAAAADRAKDQEAMRFKAPELGRPGGTFDWRADLYSLAVTACQTLGATIVFGDAGGPTVQMPLALSFDLANDEALRRILEGCLRQNPAERPLHAEVREGFRLALGDVTSTDPAVHSRPLRALGEELAATAPEWPLAAMAPSPKSPPPPAAEPATTSSESTWPAVERPADWPAASVASAPSGRPPATPTQATLSSLLPPELPHLAATLERPTDSGTASDLSALGHLEEHGLSQPEDQSLGHFEDHGLGNLEDHGLGNLEDHGLGRFTDHELAALADHDPGHLADPSAKPVPAAPTAPAQAAEALPPVDPPHRARTVLPDELAGTAAAVLAALSGESFPGSRSSVPAGVSTAAGFPGAAAAAAVPGAAAAAVPPASAPKAGELLSFDEELLNSLAPPLTSAAPAPVRVPEQKAKPWTWRGAPTPPAQAPGTAPPMAAAVETAPPGSGLGAFLGRLPRPVLFGAAAAGFLVLALAAWFFLSRGPVAAENTGAAPPLPAPPPPVESAHAKLALAKSYLGEGRSGDSQVKAALASLTFAEQAALPPGGCNEVGALEQTLAMVARETVPADLAAGLRSGDLPLLAGVLDVGSELDVPPAMKADFSRARNLVTSYQQAQAAARRGDSVQVLQRFQSLEGLQKNVRDPQELRAHAAAALENQAEALGRDGKYAEALAQLEAVQRLWPERSGIKELVKNYEQYARDEEKQLAILAGLPNFERRRKPSEGLDLWRDLKPTPHLAAQFAVARKQLEDQLAQLDAQPPQIALRDGYLLEYSRGTVVTLSFRVTDDYQVRSVKMMARPQGGRMRDMPLQKTGIGYTVDIPPSFHQNGTVEFYVVATDLSGHEGNLGTADRPLQLKRRQGFARMLH